MAASGARMTVASSAIGFDPPSRSSSAPAAAEDRRELRHPRHHHDRRRHRRRHRADQDVAVLHVRQLVRDARPRARARRACGGCPRWPPRPRATGCGPVANAFGDVVGDDVDLRHRQARALGEPRDDLRRAGARARPAARGTSPARSCRRTSTTRSSSRRRTRRPSSRPPDPPSSSPSTSSTPLISSEQQGGLDRVAHVAYPIDSLAARSGAAARPAARRASARLSSVDVLVERVGAVADGTEAVECRDAERGREVPVRAAAGAAFAEVRPSSAADLARQLVQRARPRRCVRAAGGRTRR